MHIHPFLVLLFAAIGVGLSTRLPMQDILLALKGGFDDTLGGIAMVIIAGSINQRPLFH